MKKKMPFGKQIDLLHVVSGIVLVLSGVLFCFESTVSTILLALAALVYITTMLRVTVAKKENSDEMAEENLLRAKAKSFDIMNLAFCVLGIVALLFLRGTTIALSWSKVIVVAVFASLGMRNVIVGIIFRKLEAE